MKKRAIILSAILFSIIFLNILSVQINAQEPSIPTVPFVGDINPETGLPENYENFQKIAGELSNQEQNKTYLTQEWTKILAKNKIIAPVLFYSDSFFSFFNPFWKIIFGVDFSWSWSFFFCLLIWIMFIVIFYSPSKNLTNLNPIITLIFSIVLASIMGTTGVIRKAVDFLSFAVSNFWIAFLSILIGIFLMILYSMVFKAWGKKLKEQDKKEKLEKSEKAILAHGEVSRDSLKELSRH